MSAWDELSRLVEGPVQVTKAAVPPIRKGGPSDDPYKTAKYAELYQGKDSLSMLINTHGGEVMVIKIPNNVLMSKGSQEKFPSRKDAVDSILHSHDVAKAGIK